MKIEEEGMMGKPPLAQQPNKKTDARSKGNRPTLDPNANLDGTNLTKPSVFTPNLEKEFDWGSETSSPTPSPMPRRKGVGSAITPGAGYMDPYMLAVSPSFLSDNLTPMHPSNLDPASIAQHRSMWSPSPFKHFFSPAANSIGVDVGAKDTPLSPFSSFAGSISPMHNDPSAISAADMWTNGPGPMPKFQPPRVEEDKTEKPWDNKLDLPSSAMFAAANAAFDQLNKHSEYLPHLPKPDLDQEKKRPR
eukprot:CAMPEP_0194729682 /NCGR_PEP_ID=MMETSP0296-20130528/48681_1 /TAXON_ID=39354 /ORGANISM="Heterosigma akashiwo, Strain CCMP2393" /LENGTH=247 /DNA_ID=CAMNT_0039636349 /DNA_START=97 /DNA_END=836 /DNA_ORIENTATION=+